MRNIPIVKRAALAAAVLLPGAAACSMNQEPNIPTDTDRVCLEMDGTTNNIVTKWQYALDALEDLDSREYGEQAEGIELFERHIGEIEANWEDLSSGDQSCLAQATVKLLESSTVADSEFSSRRSSGLSQAVVHIRNGQEPQHTTTTLR